MITSAMNTVIETAMKNMKDGVNEIEFRYHTEYGTVISDLFKGGHIDYVQRCFHEVLGKRIREVEIAPDLLPPYGSIIFHVTK